jgi:pepF/M3 family oligoendopeptidase
MNAEKNTAPRWDLDSIFPGGSKSEKYTSFRKNIKSDLKLFAEEISNLPQKLDESSKTQWIDFLIRLQDLYARIIQAHGFVECLTCQDTTDTLANKIYGEIDEFNGEFEKILVSLEAFAKDQSDDRWALLVDSKEIEQAAFYLNELRDIARMKMDPQFEALAAELSVNGYHAWNRLYDKIYGDLKIDFEIDGKTEQLSLGQLANKKTSPKREIRKQANEKIEELWESRAEDTAMMFNAQAGFRLSLYERRGWPVIQEPLQVGRINQATLDAMWEAVSEAGDGISRYIAAKKKLLGINNFRWYDQFAPVGSSKRSFNYKDAGDLIVEKIGEFSKSQAEFTRMALDKNWIEAEDRANKAGGAFCTDFPAAKQTRVFMTFENTFDNVMTLAHELGHAYHQHIVMELQPFAILYPMTLAETASNFNETLLADAVYQTAEDINEKLMLLDIRLQNAYTLFCDLRSRYFFDCRFYDERKNGIVEKDRLDELMLEAQKDAFFDVLSEDGYHPLFWTSKLHFFLTGQPFYHYPYTFGYLFSGGIYNRAREEGKAFAKKYESLLADTGRMTSEQVAQKHLGIDLTKIDFWREAVNRSLEDVEPFEKLVAQAL